MTSPSGDDEHGFDTWPNNRTGSRCGLAPASACAKGEALGLTVPKVDFLRRRVFVHRQAQNGQLVELKTKASRPTIPADAMILAEITRHM